MEGSTANRRGRAAGAPPAGYDPGAAHPEPRVAGERGLRALDAVFLRVERAVGRVVPEALNPLNHTGALAVVTFLIACVSGVVVLVWYSSSVHQAYASVQQMQQAPWTAGLVRSLHRYSSDACMFFVALHALRLFAARRFGGVRKLAWVTGILLIAGLWLVGWLGYWLVWDERAQQVAVGTARMMDVLPIFTDPLSRSFLTDEGINSALFFVIFFMHMLVPLGMAVPLWLHITRLSRPRFLTGAALSSWALGALVALSVLWPADLAGPAQMAVAPERMTLDGWYLLPLWITERLGGWSLWALCAGGLLLLLSPPFLLQRKKAPPAQVDVQACNACALCVEDCPYDAIRMVPRTDGRRFELQAQIDPARCVGCGICAGSCDPVAIGLEGLPALALRRQLESWAAEDARADTPSFFLLGCTRAAAGELRVDPDTGRSAELPGYRVLPVPCTGWLHSLTFEKVLKKGAGGILVVGCGPGEAPFREGVKWLRQRLSGLRRPAPRTGPVDGARVRFLQRDRASLRAVVKEAAAFRRGVLEPERVGLPARVIGAGAVIGGLMLAVLLPGNLAYRGPEVPGELVVSFKHPGRAGTACRARTEEENAAVPVHMRRAQVCERRRPDVLLRVEVNDEVVVYKRFAPGGLWGDGQSVAMERVSLTPGTHRVRVSIDESGTGEEFGYQDAREITLRPRHRGVVQFERTAGFTWSGGV